MPCQESAPQRTLSHVDNLEMVEEGETKRPPSISLMPGRSAKEVAQRLSFQIAPWTARRKQTDNLLQEPK
jgi:hypothetical protein